MGKSQSKKRKEQNSPTEPETHPGDIKHKGGNPRVTKYSVQEFTDFTDPAITGHSKSIDNSKRNETTTGSTQYHDDRPEFDIFGSKDNRDFNVNTEATEYSESSESTNGNVQTIPQVTEPAIDYNDTGGNSENYEQTITMAKEDEKETKKKKKKKLITTITITNSKGNETTTGGTQIHSIRPEDNRFGNKDNRYVNVNTHSAGYSKSSESTNGNAQTITRVRENAIIDNNDTGGNDINQIDQLDGGPVSPNQSDTPSCPNVQTANDITEIDQLDGGPVSQDQSHTTSCPNVQTANDTAEIDLSNGGLVSHDKSDTSSCSNVQTANDVTEIDHLDGGLVSHDQSDTSSCSNVQTANSETYEQTIPMAKEDEKETKKKKKENIFSTSVTMDPSKEETSEPMKAEYRLTEEDNTDGKNKMSVTEQQVKAMMMEANRLAERCRCDIEASNANGEELKLCPEAFIQSISSVKEYISNLILEKNDYLNRLSSVAGSRLTDNNPNIANLHDPNRPMILADRFNRIYDDEWTDMIERLEMKGPNTQEHKYKCVYHLYSVLIVIFISLSKKAEVQLQGLAEHLFLLTKPSTEQITATWVENKEERVQLIASRKKTAETTISMLHQTLQTDPIFIKELRKCSPPLEVVMLEEIAPSKYFKNCVEICWHFVIQDPPMYVEIVSLKGKKINKDTHKVFTKSGDIVKYHVWPALYLHHQDGNNSPLMGKGVVQPE